MHNMIGKLNINSDERGMTGIGVLILFIALVLVAAIASGLILDTAGFLQNTAQETGEQSTAEVSDRLSVLSASGEVFEETDADGNVVDQYVNELSLTVYRSPGAGDVDLQHATIEYYATDGAAFLIHEDELEGVDTTEDDVADNLGAFTVEAVKDDDGSIPVLNSRDDRAAINIALDDDGGDNETVVDVLREGETATLRITTQSGATTTEIVNVPESLAGYGGSTVLL